MKNQSWALSSVAQLAKRGLKRVLGVSDLFGIGYGDLGSSIYYALGITALFALGSTPIALGLAGIVFVCTALTYAEMTSTFHESGGSASFARHAFNDLVSFIAGWGLLLDYIVTIAISSFAVAPYLSCFYPDFKIVSIQIAFTIGLIFVLYIVNFLGVKQSTKVSFFLTCFTILTQIVIILIGTILLMNIPYIIDHMRINVPNMSWSPTWPEFWKGTAMAMVAYTGIESIAQLGAEAKKPSFSVPRAIIITMVVLIIMYFGISSVALSVISPHELGTKYITDPIAGIAAALPIGSKVLTPWIGILAAVILTVAANAGLIGASRLSFNMGEYYQLPRFFYRVHNRFRTPYIALLFFALFAALVVLWSRGKLTFLADLYNFGAMLAFFSAHLSLIVLRIKRPELKRPFRVPLNIPFGKFSIPLTAVIGCLATAAVWILIVITKPDGRYLGLAWLAFGTLMYFGYRRKERFSPTGQLKIQRIKIPEYESMRIKHILLPTRGGLQTETVQMACEIAKQHGAKITAVYVLEIPYTLPLDSDLGQRELIAASVLKRTEAIARELGVVIDLQMLRSRSIPETILEVLHQNKYDLLVLGALKSSEEAAHKGLGAVTEKILREATCRVWVCASDYKGKRSSSTRLLPKK